MFWRGCVTFCESRRDSGHTQLSHRVETTRARHDAHARSSAPSRIDNVLREAARCQNVGLPGDSLDAEMLRDSGHVFDRVTRIEAQDHASICAPSADRIVCRAQRSQVRRTHAGAAREYERQHERALLPQRGQRGSPARGDERNVGSWGSSRELKRSWGKDQRADTGKVNVNLRPIRRRERRKAKGKRKKEKDRRAKRYKAKEDLLPFALYLLPFTLYFHVVTPRVRLDTGRCGHRAGSSSSNP